MTSKLSPTSLTPFEMFKQRFTLLYRILLLLGIFSAILSLTSITTITKSIGYLASDISYAISGILAVLVVLPLMIASLILLWNKHPAGIRLRLLAYGLSALCTGLMLLAAPETIAPFIDSAVEAAQKSGAGIDDKSARMIAETSYYGTLYATIATSGLFAWLWSVAWKKQKKHDTN